MSILETILGQPLGGPVNQSWHTSTPELAANYQRWLMNAQTNVYAPPPEPRYRSIKPATRISDKAAKLYQVSGILRDA